MYEHTEQEKERERVRVKRKKEGGAYTGVVLQHSLTTGENLSKSTGQYNSQGREFRFYRSCREWTFEHHSTTLVSFADSHFHYLLSNLKIFFKNGIKFR
jgi:hypothetical protein